VFTFTTKYNFDNEELTKRKVVSQAAKLFDPLGLVNPIVISAKIFIQNLWKRKIDWDQVLPEDFSSQ
jgi:hypothetical protein